MDGGDEVRLSFCETTRVLSGGSWRFRVWR